MLVTRHSVHRTRQELMLLRETVSAWASDVVAKVESFEPFGGTRLVVTLRTCLQVEEKLPELPKLKVSEPKPGTPFLTHKV